MTILSQRTALDERPKVYIQPDVLYKDVWSLLFKLKELAARIGSFEGMLCITNGGLQNARLVAEVLDIEYVDTIGLKSKNGTQDVIVTKPLSPETVSRLRDRKLFLLYDEVIDSAKTVLFAHRMIRAVTDPIEPRVATAGIHAKPRARGQLEYYFGRETPDEDFNVYPDEAEYWHRKK